MKLSYVSIACLIGSSIVCGILNAHRLSNPLAFIVQPSVVALPMVWYIGRRQSATGPLDIVAFVLSLGIAVLWALALAVRGGPQHEMGGFVVLGLCATVLLVMPLLCLLAFLTPKRSEPEPRGFPVLPVTEKKDGRFKT